MARFPSREREYQRDYRRGYRAARPDYVNGERERARLYMQGRRDTDQEFKQSQASSSKEWRRRLKDKVFVAYGGWKCACCGEKERSFLELDHINGDGGHHRKSLTGKNVGSNCYIIYRDLEKNGFPPGYQILCANCNVGKQRNGGVCPHKDKCQRRES